jgi:hypothetical protein
MSKRKCVFTGLPAILKNSVIPNKVSEDVLHNWANGVPCSEEYSKIKKDRMPDEWELQAVECFQALELSKLKVEFYQNKLNKIQEILKERIPETPKMPNRKRKDIEKAFKLKEVLEESEEMIVKILEEKTKGFWNE